MILQILLLSIMANAEAGAQPSSLAHRAEAAFGRLNYSESVALYQQARATQPEAAWLEFNLGTSAIADSQFGLGALHLRRAQVLAPRSEGIRHNLSVVRERRQDVLDERETFFATRFAASSVGRLTATERRLAWGLIVALGTIAARASGRRRTLGAWGMAGLLLGLNIAWPVGLFTFEQELRRSAVVMANELVVRASTHPDSLVRFRLHAGAEVEIRDAQQEWVRVRLDARRDGWTHREGLCRVLEKT